MNFNVLLFTTARTRKPSICPCTDEWIKKIWYIDIYKWNITQPLKGMKYAIGSNMDGPRDAPTKWSKSEKDTYHITYMWNLKYDKQWTYLQNGLTDIENKRGRGWRDKLGVGDWHTHTIIYSIDEASQVMLMVKNLPANQEMPETRVPSLGQGKYCIICFCVCMLSC